MMEFLGGTDNRCIGARQTTPNSCPGLTIWIGRLVFTASWERDGFNKRGFDLYFGDRELFRRDFD
jgi:hypothetical protein